LEKHDKFRRKNAEERIFPSFLPESILKALKALRQDNAFPS